MPTFQYKARTEKGEPKEGAIEASSEEAVLDILQQTNLVVTSLKKTGNGIGFDIQNIKMPWTGRVKQKDIVVFSRQLATLFEAKIPVVQALRTLAEEITKSTLQKITTEITNDVSGGMALSQAMSKHPNIFTSFYVNLIRSGEESGKLEEVFTYLADYLERSYYLMSKARNAMMYPAFILAAFIGVLTVMLVVVMPRLFSIFEEAGQELPFFTKLVIALSNFLREFGIFIFALLIAGGVALWRWALTPKGKEFVDRMQLKIPIIGALYRKLYMARFADNLRTLIMGGIPILRALGITGDVVGNTVFQKAIKNAIESVRGGNTISSAFEKTPEIPPLVTQMIKIGEATGKLDFILGSLAKFYQREVDSMVDNLLTLIEPILIVFLGGGVALMVAAVLVPLYNLVGTL